MRRTRAALALAFMVLLVGLLSRRYRRVRFLRRRNSLPHHNAIGTTTKKFAAKIVRDSKPESNPVESGFPNSLRCRVPCIRIARDSSRGLGERERHAPIATRRTSPDVPRQPHPRLRKALPTHAKGRRQAPFNIRIDSAAESLPPAE